MMDDDSEGALVSHITHKAVIYEFQIREGVINISS